VRLQEVAVAMLFNPTSYGLNVSISLPLYYAGLDDAAVVSVDGGPPTVMPLSRQYTIVLPMSMPPTSIHTVVINRVVPPPPPQ
jgi:hypothetical protein